MQVWILYDCWDLKVNDYHVIRIIFFFWIIIHNYDGNNRFEFQIFFKKLTYWLSYKVIGCDLDFYECNKYKFFIFSSYNIVREKLRSPYKHALKP